MKMDRWPVHPSPLPDEALSSWVARLSDLYDCNPRVLFREGLGLELVRDFLLDSDPPAAVIDGLSARTGFRQADIRKMTLQSWTPTLIDRLTADFEGAAYNDYVHSYSVLLPPARSNGTRIIDWTAWTSPELFKNPFVCRQCLDTEKEPYHRLHWRTCVMATCPVHKTYLQTTEEIKNEDLVGGKRRGPEAAPMSLMRLDAMTLDAIRTGHVAFDGRKIKGGDWFRLLRTVLDELSTAMITAASENEMLQRIWQQSGVITRVREFNWRPFENLDPNERRSYMLAASTAFEMISRGQVALAGEDGTLLNVPKRKGKSDPTPVEILHKKRKPSADHRVHKQRARAKATFDWAKRDPQGAKYVREALMSNDAEVKEAFVDYALSELGIDTGVVITDGMYVGVDKKSLSHWEGRRMYPRR